MTKREKHIQSMLNYYGIDMGGKRDEKMSKEEKKTFMDTLNASFDAQVVEDVLKKVRDRLKDQSQESEETDPFFDSLNKENEDEIKFPKDLNSFFGDKGSNGKLPFGLNPDIENFISWISDTLYSSDHKVVITEENGITNIRLEKIKKKRGGRKK